MEEASGASALEQRPRFNEPELDALRFFAFALVFCDHAPIGAAWFDPLREIGGFGVALFFCLSAYLIVTLLLREREHTGRVNLRAFAARRVLRVLPLYLVIVGIGAAMGLYWPTIRLDPKYVLALLLFYANLFCQHYLWMGVGCLAPLWSISVEAQFYVAIAFTAKLRRRSIAILCGVVVMTSYGLLLHFGRAGFNPVLQVWPNTLVQFQFFAAGALVAVLLFGRRLGLALVPRLAIGLAGLGLFWIAALVCGISSAAAVSAERLLTGYLCELGGTAVIFLAVLNVPLGIPRWLRYLGKISYGLYGFHSLLLWFTFTRAGGLSAVANGYPVIASAVALCGTTLLAIASYEFFEKPILRRKQRFEVEKTRI